MTEILKGKPVSDAVKADVADRALKLKKEGISPLLVIVRAGEREDDIAYEKRVIRNCSEVHIGVKTAVFPQDVQHDVFLQALRDFSEDPEVHGILVLRPLPEQISDREAGAAIDSVKDIDCMNPENLKNLYWRYFGSATLYAGGRDRDTEILWIRDPGKKCCDCQSKSRPRKTAVHAVFKRTRDGDSLSFPYGAPT